MSAQLELVTRALANVSVDGAVEMVAALESGRTDGVQGLLDPEAEIRFLALDEDDLPARRSAFRGRRGYVEGWLEWLAPYESFVAKPSSLRDATDARVLLEVHGEALLRSSGIEVDLEAAAIYGFDGERIVCADHYLSLEQARRAAGLLA